MNITSSPLQQDVPIETNVRSELTNPKTGEAQEIDIYLPSLKLGFEYQVSRLKSVLQEST